MTGTVVKWHADSKQGTINTEDGRRVHFGGEAVWPYDLIKMSVGQIVSFDLPGGSRSAPANVRRCDQEPFVNALKTSATTGHLQYEGFTHTANVREYRFQRLVAGQPTEHFIVCAELRLLAKHHIALQAGPAVCRQVLESILKALGEAPCVEKRRLLTDEDLRAHAAADLTPGRWGQQRPAMAKTAATTK